MISSALLLASVGALSFKGSAGMGPGSGYPPNGNYGDYTPDRSHLGYAADGSQSGYLPYGAHSQNPPIQGHGTLYQHDNHQDEYTSSGSHSGYSPTRPGFTPQLDHGGYPTNPGFSGHPQHVGQHGYPLEIGHGGHAMQASGQDPISVDLGSRIVYIEFQDGLSVQVHLRPSYVEPYYVTNPPPPGSTFESYNVYLLVHLGATHLFAFEGENTDLRYGQIRDFSKHRPKKILLTANAPGSKDEYVAQDIKVYTSKQQLSDLTLPTKKKLHFGYLVVAVKETRFRYLSKINVNLKSQKRRREQVEPSVSGQQSAGSSGSHGHNSNQGRQFHQQKRPARQYFPNSGPESG